MDKQNRQLWRQKQQKLKQTVRYETVTLMTFSKIVSRKSSSAFWSNSFPWMILICLRNVDLPLSPAPSSRIFTRRRTERLSRASMASISRLRRFASRSGFTSRSRARSFPVLLSSWAASAGSRHRLRVRTTPAILYNFDTVSDHLMYSLKCPRTSLYVLYKIDME